MRRAFTLIELLIVVAIIGILAAIAVPNFLNARVRAKIAKVDSDQNALSKALEMYLLDNNSYPGDHDLD
ncbi:MAG TPA: prepilin-type N-terminal cleavage/methylation domain-containing protein, partial [bacterium]|nr:prepilin-type N-terminal cleavage/methylation domain-containing protein [bacterium]